jgi:predicted nuclease with TOPRIM domain
MTNLIEKLEGHDPCCGEIGDVYEAVDELKRQTKIIADLNEHYGGQADEIEAKDKRIAELEKSIELSGTISNYAQETIESAQRKRIAELEKGLREIVNYYLIGRGEYVITCYRIAKAALREDES